MSEKMSAAFYRSDLYNIFESWQDWDALMRDAGFSAGWEYKQYLLNSGVMDKNRAGEYEGLTVARWKEISSERIMWSQLPHEFSWNQLLLPYRSPLLSHIHHELAKLQKSLSEVDFRSEQWTRLFPYQDAIEKLRAIDLDAEDAFRKKLVQQTDDDVSIVAARSHGVEPIGRVVSLKEVKLSIQRYCLDRNLARPAGARLPKGSVVYGRDFGNGLVLCFAMWEVQLRSSEGFSVYRLNASQSLVRKEHFDVAWDVPVNIPWSGIPELSLYPAYGLKDKSAVSFYVNLAYQLKSFQMRCEAFDAFFGLS